MSKKQTPAEGALETRMEDLSSIVKKGTEAISGINNLFTFADNITKLVSRLGAGKEDLRPGFWTDSQADRSTTSPERGARTRQRLYDSQRQLVEMSGQSSQGLSADQLASRPVTALADPLALAISSAVTLVDGYLTRRTLRKGFSEVTRELVAIQDVLDSGFDGLQETMKNGLGEVTQTLQGGFDRLDARFSWGFSELIWRLDQQTELAVQARDILLRPLDVQARELRARGIRNYDNGWYPEALEDLLDAMKKSRVDFIVAHYIGLIYLINERNYDQAAHYFGLAARYSKPYHKPAYIAALMYKALTHYLSDSGALADRCAEAVSCVREAIAVAPEEMEFHYQLAQYLVLAEDREAAAEELEWVIRRDPAYLVKILAEADFEGLQPEIERVVLKFQEELSKSFVSLFSRVRAALTPAISFFDGRKETPPFSAELDRERYEKAYHTAFGALNALTEISVTFGRGDLFSAHRAFCELSEIEIPEFGGRDGTVLVERWGSYLEKIWFPSGTTSYCSMVTRHSSTVEEQTVTYFAIGEKVL